MFKNEKGKALIKIIKDTIVDASIVYADTQTNNAAGVIKRLVDSTKVFFDELNKQKLYEFYMGIYEVDDDAVKKLSEADLAFIIKKLIQDDEIRKTDLYSKLAVNVAKGDYPEEERVDFISTLSNLTLNDINFIRKVYIYDHLKIKSFKNKGEQLLNLSETQDGRQIKSLNKLYSNGLIFEPNKGKASHQYYEPTNYLYTFIKLIFDEYDLTPGSIGEEEKIKSDIFFEQNSTYITNKLLYDTKIITPLKELGYSLSIDTNTYGPYNYNAEVYISIDNDKPFVKLEDGKDYLSLIIERNYELFFNAYGLQLPRYHVCADLLNNNDGENETTLLIKDALKNHIEDVKNSI